MYSVSQRLAHKHGITGRPGSKVECPFCGHRTFSIKSDDSLGKCFHPSCGMFITPSAGKRDRSTGLEAVLRDIFRDFHQTLLNQQNEPGTHAYAYFTEERKIHPQVVADSMLGAVPPEYDLDAKFAPLLAKIAGSEREEDNEEQTDFIEKANSKLRKCITAAPRWTCFFYADAYHHITGIRFRRPYSKRCLYFKPFRFAGLFGRELFSPLTSAELSNFNEKLIVAEGEFNQLQLQSLLIRFSEEMGRDWGYINACAVGGVTNADFSCIRRVAKSPIMCYDNDASGAGYQLVEKARDKMSVTAITTPDADSDLDSYIRSFGEDHRAAWEGVKMLIAGGREYYRHFHSVAAEIFQTRKKKYGGDLRREFEINADVADRITSDLADRGRFYTDLQEAYFFLRPDRKLIPLTYDNPDCALLLDNYGINRTESVFRYLVEDLRVHAHKRGTRTQIHRLAYYERDSATVYLYNNANQVYRIGLDTVDLVDNGTDGVLFLSNPKTTPFVVGKEAPDRSLFDEIILSKINFASDVLTPDQRRVLLTYWFLSLFFSSIMAHKPILAFIGEKGSGKSITLRKLGMLLYGEQFDVVPLPSKVDDFDVAIANSEFLTIDNADSKCRWLEDRLAVIATGGTIKRRVLYTTNTVIDIPVRCNIAITARTPHFKRDDVADRLLVMRVDRFDRFAAPEKLLREILDNRDAIMTEVVYLIQDALSSLKNPSADTDTIDLRMADFGAFAMSIAQHHGMGDQMTDILKKLPVDQSVFALEENPIAELLEDWVPSNEGRFVSSSELCSELSQVADGNGTAFHYKGRTIAFALKLKALLPNLRQFYRIEQREMRSRKKTTAFWLMEKESLN